jgi:hypothetical protein
MDIKHCVGASPTRLLERSKSSDARGFFEAVLDEQLEYLRALRNQYFEHIEACDDGKEFLDWEELYIAANTIVLAMEKEQRLGEAQGLCSAAPNAMEKEGKKKNGN